MNRSSNRVLTIMRGFKDSHGALWKTYRILVAVPAMMRIRRAFKRIKYEKREGAGKAVIYSVRTIPDGNLNYFDAIFAHGLQKLGCDVKMLVCDGVLDSCDADTVAQDQRMTCFACNRFRKVVEGITGLDYLSFRQYIAPSDIEEMKKTIAMLDFETCNSFEYLGVNVGKHARSAAVRYFLTGWLDADNPRHLEILREKLLYALIVTRVANNLYSREKPSRIIMLHGIYATWGPFADFFINKGVDVIIYAQTVGRFGCFMFGRNRREYELIAPKTWAELRQTPLTDEEEKQIDDYFSARFKGTLGERIIYEKNIDPTSDKHSSLSSLSDEKYLRRYVLYPNLAWDACVEGRGSAAFNDLFAWLRAIIDYFKAHTDYQLIIKLHPAELVWEKGTRSVAEYISHEYSNLPENIFVLPPDTPLTAYELITPGAICLTFMGTIGLELAVQGVPVLAGGNAHYIDAGVVCKIETAAEYMNLLDNPAELFEFAKNNQKLAKKYAHFYYFRLMIKIPFYRDDAPFCFNWAEMNKINKILDDNGAVMRICRRIIGKDDIVFPLV